MIINLLKFIKYWKEVAFVITVIVGYISSNPIKKWLISDIEKEVSALKQEVKTAKKVACGMLKIQILQTQMSSILLIENQDNIESEKKRQIEFMKIITEEYKKTSKYCEYD